jgi:hypothetical protein
VLEEKSGSELQWIALENASVPVRVLTAYSALTAFLFVNYLSVICDGSHFPLFWLVGIAACKMTSQIASWDTRFELGTKSALLLPFSPIVVAADENEQIR